MKVYKWKTGYDGERWAVFESKHLHLRVETSNVYSGTAFVVGIGRRLFQLNVR